MEFVQDEAVDNKGCVADKRTTGGWKACCFVLGNEILDRVGFFAILSNLVTYTTTILHEGTAAAAKGVNNWIGTIYMVSVLGGFLADTAWGRYRTIIVMSAFYIMGLTLLTLSSSVKTLKPPHCSGEMCPSASKQQLAFFNIALYLMAIGCGCMKPCASSFGADQFDENDPVEVKKKASFFNWWFWGVHVAQFTAVTALVYVQDNVGWSWGFGIPTVFVALSMIVFLCGTPKFRFQKPRGSPLTTIATVISSAVSKWKKEMPSSKTRLTFLDRAAVEEINGEFHTDQSKKPWNVCTRAQVEETKLFLRILPMWFGTLLFSTVVAQNPTLFVRQGSTLQSGIFSGKLKIPPASMLLFTNLTVFICMPLYDRIFVPFVRKHTGQRRGITLLQRMGFGVFVTVATMVSAALVETRRLRIAKENPTVKILPMSIFWLIPQYLLLGIAQVFTYSGQIEFFYDQVPDSMRSLGAALQLTNLGAGSFLSSILITIVNKVTSPSPWIQHSINKGHLNYFYWLLAALNVVNLGVFIPLAMWFKYKHSHIATEEADSKL